jgi:hypothetical protein
MGARGKVSAYTERIPLRVTRAMDFELKLLASLEQVSVATLIRRILADSLRSEKPAQSPQAKKFAQIRKALGELQRLSDKVEAAVDPEPAPTRTWPAEYETEEDWLAAKKLKKKMKKQVNAEIKKKKEADAHTS